jgi:hypothetical protein
MYAVVSPGHPGTGVSIFMPAKEVIHEPEAEAREMLPVARQPMSTKITK